MVFFGCFLDGVAGLDFLGDLLVALLGDLLAVLLVSFLVFGWHGGVSFMIGCCWEGPSLLNRWLLFCWWLVEFGDYVFGWDDV